MTRQDSGNAKIIGAIIVVAVVALAAWWYFSRMPGLDFSRNDPAPLAPASASTAPLPIEHPIADVQTAPAPATTAPLPALFGSDAKAADSLSGIKGAQGLAALLLAKGLIPHVVATVDALPRRTIGASILPLRTPAGAFAVDTSNPAQATLDPKNFARYDAYVKVVAAMDARALVTWYAHWYPLFQQAYRELGYPRGYFNDRLLVAIDDMLAAPNAQPPIALVKTDDGHWAFADGTWETLSVGQKLMIRVGPDNERALKDKLRTLRALLLGKAPHLHAATSASSG